MPKPSFASNTSSHPSQLNCRRCLRSILAAMLALCLLSGCALAFESKAYPAPSGTLPADSLSGSFGDTQLLLGLDTTQDYSFVENGFARACFFAFDEDQSHYIELYLTLPSTVVSGDVLVSSDVLATGTSIYLYEVTPDGETLYSADQLLGVAFPAGSSYEIRISEASRTDSSLSLSGSIAACLVLSEEAALPLALTDVSFSFTLPLGDATSGKQPGMQAVPAFTLPPDYARA